MLQTTTNPISTGKQRALAVLLALCMIFSMIPMTSITAFAGSNTSAYTHRQVTTEAEITGASYATGITGEQAIAYANALIATLGTENCFVYAPNGDEYSYVSYYPQDSSYIVISGNEGNYTAENIIFMAENIDMRTVYVIEGPSTPAITVGAQTGAVIVGNGGSATFVIAASNFATAPEFTNSDIEFVGAHAGVTATVSGNTVTVTATKDAAKGDYKFTVKSGDIKSAEVTFSVIERIKRTRPLDFSNLNTLTKTDGTTPVTADANGAYVCAEEGWSWDNATKTLTLDGATIDCSAVTDCAYAINLSDEAIIALTSGTVNTVKSGCGEISLSNTATISSFAVYSTGTVSIRGNGTLDTYSHDVHYEDISGTHKRMYSVPLYVNLLNVGTANDAPTVNATAGSATSANSVDHMAFSYGIRKEVNLTNGNITATAGTANGYAGATSAGISKITINGGTVNATGSTATAEMTPNSYGVGTVTISGGTMNVTGKDYSVYTNITVIGATITGSETYQDTGTLSPAGIAASGIASNKTIKMGTDGEGAKALTAKISFAPVLNVIEVDLDNTDATPAVGYTSFAEGWKVAVGEGNTANTTVKLLDNWTATDTGLGDDLTTGNGFQGGGLYIKAPTGETKTITLDLNGKTIDRKLSAQTANGFVIHISTNGKLTLNDSVGGGKITGGNNSAGGGILVFGGTFIMNGGCITGNYSASDGGGIMVRSNTTITGGSIVGNACGSTRFGAGVCYSGGTLSVSGNPVIKDNFKGGVFDNGVYVKGDSGIAQNLFLNSTIFTIGAPLTSGADIHIFSSAWIGTIPKAVSEASDADYSAYFHSDKDELEVTVSAAPDNKIQLVAKGPKITVGTQTGTLTYGDTTNNTATFDVATSNFTATFAPEIKWYDGTTWGSTAPAGLSAAMTDENGKVTVTYTSANAGTYKFKVVSGTVESAEAALTVGKADYPDTVQLTENILINKSQSYYDKLITAADFSGTLPEGAVITAYNQVSTTNGIVGVTFDDAAKGLHVVSNANLTVENVTDTYSVTIASTNYKDITATLNFTTIDIPTYTISVDNTSYDFGSIKSGYTQPAAVTVTVTNTGNQSVTLTQPTSTNYIIGALTKTVLAAGEIATFTVQPKEGLTYGNRDEAITVSTDHSTSAVANAKFSVADETVPTAEISIGTNTWHSFLNTVTFGLFFKETKTVKVTAADTESGVAKIEYLLSATVFTDEASITGTWNDITAAKQFDLNMKTKQYIYVRVTDADGNFVIINSGGVVIYQDSTTTATRLDFTLTSRTNLQVPIIANGNSIASVSVNNRPLTSDAYRVNAEGFAFDARYLNTLKADEYTVVITLKPMRVAYAAATGNDAPTNITLKLYINRATSSVTNISDISKEYDGTAVSAPTYTKVGTGTEKVEYKVRNTADSTYTTDAPKNAGDYTVRVSLGSNAIYGATSAEADFTISQKSVTITGATVKASKEYDGNTNAEITANGTLSDNYDGTNLTIKAGTAVYSDKAVAIDKTVTFTGFELDGSAKDNYKLSAQPASVTASITTKELTVNVSVNDKKYDGKNTATFNGTPSLEGIVSGDDVNLINGTPTFASIAVGDNIAINFTDFSISGADAANYKLTQPTGIKASISEFIATKDTEYSVNSNDWQNVDFVITAKTGYKVSKTNTATGTWADTLTASDETATGSFEFYVKNTETGAISEKVTEGYKIDKTNPTGDIQFNSSTVKKLINTISFGLFFKDTVNVEITAEDTAAGIASIQYIRSEAVMTEEAVKASTDWKAYTSISEEAKDTGKFIYYVMITDNAGNVTYFGSDGATFDTTAPAITGIKTGKTYCEDKQVIVADTNLKEIKVDGVADDKLTFTLTFGTHTIVATDMAGNETTVSVTIYATHDWNDGEITTPATAATDGVKTFTCNHCGETKIEAVDKLAPVIIEGENGNVQKGADGTLTFRSNAAFADFISVEVDGKVVDSKNYDLKEGSIIVTLKADYINTLSAGKHTLSINSVSGSADTDFTVTAKQTGGNSPQTGDTTNMALWFALLFVSGGALATLGISKKRRKNAAK